jgi:hypothetical protein
MDPSTPPQLLFNGPASLDDVLSPATAMSGWLNTSTYQWVHDVAPSSATIDPCGIVISGGKDEAGNSMATYADSDYFAVDIQVGLAEGHTPGLLRAFPNPVRSGGTLTFVLPNSRSRASVHLLNAMGATVATWELGTSQPNLQQVVTLPEVMPGLYMLRTSTGMRPATLKLIVE